MCVLSSLCVPGRTCFLPGTAVQGFTKGTMAPTERWYGYIKDYDGGTLMQCEIHHDVNYADIPGMVRRQREVSATAAVCGGGTLGDNSSPSHAPPAGFPLAPAP